MLILLSSCGIKKGYDGIYTTNPQGEKDIIYLANKSFFERPNIDHSEKILIENHPTERIHSFRRQMDLSLITSYSYPPADWTNCEDNSLTQLVLEEQIKSTISKPFVILLTNEKGERGLLGQKISRPLEPNKKYQFSFEVAFQKTFKSIKFSNPELIEIPTKLRFWASNDGCELEELLYESPLIDNTDWQELKFQFIPKNTFSHIIFEPYCTKESPKNCNILLRNLSNIRVLN